MYSELPEITARIKDGDSAAFKLLFDELYKPLCHYAMYVLHDMDDAEDAVQKTFVILWQHRGQLQISTSLKNYLYSAVKNTCLNRLKHLKVRDAYAGYVQGANEPYTEGNKLLQKELRQKIHDAVEQLPEQCRLVFKMSRVDELKYAEIADKLNISIKTVENHMGKALKLLRLQLSDYLAVLAWWCINQLN